MKHTDEPAAVSLPPARTLRLVNTAADASPGPAMDVVVLDTSWSPVPGPGPAHTPLRPALLEILDEENLFDRSLRLIDAWAEACDLPGRFARDEVTWWFHARSFLRLDLQELLIWGRVLDRLAPEGRYGTIVVPDDRPRLADAVSATRPNASMRVTTGTPYASADLTGRPAEEGQLRRGPRRSAMARLRSPASKLLATIGGRHPRKRAAIIAERLERLASGGSLALGLVRAPSFHHVETDGMLVRRDPYLGPVFERLAASGDRVALLAIGASARKAVDWKWLKHDDVVLPHSLLRDLEDAAAPARLGAAEREIAERFASMPTVPIQDGDRDFGPAMDAAVGRIGPWLARQWREMDRAGTLLDILRPRALVTGWEAARTAWLGAARARGIRSIAIQHGVIYPDTPDYCRPASPLLVRPDVTCVYGPYEKGILIGAGGYAEHEVLVSGSPRVDPDSLLAVPQSLDDRTAVRDELGIAAGNRMLVISGGRMSVGDRLGTLPLLGRVLDGPLPGVHVVVKLHPEEPDGEHYRDLLTGLARARDYPCPPISIIRDVDLYRLLRAADAHLGVYSTVLTDAVLAGTPNLIVVGQALADLIGYVRAGVAHPVRNVNDVRDWLASPVPLDPDARRRFIADHYRAGDAASRVVEALGRAEAGTA